MADYAHLVCYACRFVLPLGVVFPERFPMELPRAVAGRGPQGDGFGPGDTAGPYSSVTTRALWKFLSQHLYHPVELLGEASPAWEWIDVDFVQVDSDIRGDPSLAAYADGGWAGEALALRPRPVSRAVSEVVLRAGDVAGGWTSGEGDRGAARRLLGALDFSVPADVVVDDTVVLARLSLVREALMAVRREAGAPLGKDLGALLRDCAAVVPAPDSLPVQQILADSGPLAAPYLFDLERALRVIQGFLPGIDSAEE